MSSFDYWRSYRYIRTCSLNICIDMLIRFVLRGRFGDEMMVSRTRRKLANQFRGSMPDQEGEGHGHMHRISGRHLHQGPAWSDCGHWPVYDLAERTINAADPMDFYQNLPGSFNLSNGRSAWTLHHAWSGQTFENTNRKFSDGMLH